MNFTDYEMSSNICLILSKASRFMRSFQSDILLDVSYIVSQVTNGESIECYVSRTHFDTELRFKYTGCNELTDEEQKQKGREEARRIGWGDIILTFKAADNNELQVEVETINDEEREMREMLRGLKCFNINVMFKN